MRPLAVLRGTTARALDARGVLLTLLLAAILAGSFFASPSSSSATSTSPVG